MLRHQWGWKSIAVGTLIWAGTPVGSAQNATRQNQGSEQPGSVVMDRPEELIATALRSNPVTAPYPITARWRNNAVDLSGRVGTKQIHDVAVRTAIAYGFPFRDNLVIDTAMTAQVAANAGMGMGPGGPAGPMGASVTASSYYVYPPPLFGKLDDPFFGFVPPLVSFPPWWQRQGASASAASGQAAAGTQRPPAAAAPAQAGWRPLEVPPAQGEVEVSVDSSGQVFLRGVVTSDAVAREVEEMARSVPGVRRVYSDLQVRPRRAPDAATDPSRRGPNADVPPPAPQPVTPPPPGAVERKEPEMVKPRLAPEPPPPRIPSPKGITPKTSAPAGLSTDNQELSRRVSQVIERSDALQKQSIKIRSEADVVTLSGRVETAYEAMLAYRAAQQTPGVKDVIDLLEFTVPDEDHPNPLPQKARAEDLEPYLAAQIRRNVGDLARIERLKVHGDILTIQGTVGDDANLDRVLAIVRSIPILHGFRLEATLSTN